MPKAGPAELAPPGGTYLVGYRGGTPVRGEASNGCRTGPARSSACMWCRRRVGWVWPRTAVGPGGCRTLAGYRVVRLDTGSRQPHAIAFYEAAGYRRVGNFNDNPAAAFHGEKSLD